MHKMLAKWPQAVWISTLKGVDVNLCLYLKKIRGNLPTAAVPPSTYVLLQSLLFSFCYCFFFSTNAVTDLLLLLLLLLLPWTWQSPKWFVYVLNSGQIKDRRPRQLPWAPDSKYTFRRWLLLTIDSTTEITSWEYWPFMASSPESISSPPFSPLLEGDSAITEFWDWIVEERAGGRTDFPF